jgi:hypothetical protein
MLLLFAIAHTFLGNPEARRAEDALHRMNVMVNRKTKWTRILKEL